MRKISLIVTLALILAGVTSLYGRDDLTWLEDQVRHELVTLSYYTVFDNLEFKTEGDKVILMGSVTRPTLKTSAERVVAKIEGVTEVVNNIEVLPLSNNDDRIRIREYRAIYGNSSFTRYAFRAVPPIHIVVKNGHVTLEGTVATKADRDHAGILAKGVSDVFSVTNNLAIED